MENFKQVDDLVNRSGIITSKKELVTLARQGYKSIISLEALDPALQSFAKKVGIKVYNIPIDDYEAPTMRETLRMIAAIERTRALGAKTLIHCQHGKQRSGTMATLYLASKGMHPLQAYHLHDYGISDRQKEFIMKNGTVLAELVKKRTVRRIQK
ncbi:MAG: dual specificity protein phosphatase family protein [archaeon]|jgi:protein tyrosine/serine phosphatase